jgi:hypothetical protein
VPPTNAAPPRAAEDLKDGGKTLGLTHRFERWVHGEAPVETNVFFLRANEPAISKQDWRRRLKEPHVASSPHRATRPALVIASLVVVAVGSRLLRNQGLAVLTITSVLVWGTMLVCNVCNGTMLVCNAGRLEQGVTDALTWATWVWAP